MRRGAAAASPVSPANVSMTVAQAGCYIVLPIYFSCLFPVISYSLCSWLHELTSTGAVKERSDRDEHSEADDNPSAPLAPSAPSAALVSTSRHQEDTAPGSSVFLALCAPQLHRCNTSKGE